jgi:pentapeptide MXKDX repeat protein
MKLASILTNANKTMDWKVLVVIAGLMLSVNLTACSTSEKAPADAMKGDAMKGDSMKKDGDAMKGDAMKKDGDAMKGDAMKKDGDAMKGDSMKKDGDAMQKSPSPTATNKP